MLRGEIRGLVAAILACVLLVSFETGRAHAEGDDVPDQACVTHSEYDSLEQGRGLAWVQGLFDIPGHAGPTHADEWSQEFKTCWATGVKSVRVWFDASTNLSTHWLIVDA